jgi:hypothetical protein
MFIYLLSNILQTIDDNQQVVVAEIHGEHNFDDIEIAEEIVLESEQQIEQQHHSLSAYEEVTSTTYIIIVFFSEKNKTFFCNVFHIYTVSTN